MAKETLDKIDVYLLAAIAVFSLLLIAVELVPMPTTTVVEQALPGPVKVVYGGIHAAVMTPPSPITTMATVTVA